MAKSKRGNKNFAIKRIGWKKIIQNKEIVSEIRILRQMNHPRVIGLVDVFVDENFLQIVLELYFFELFNSHRDLEQRVMN